MESGDSQIFAALLEGYSGPVFVVDDKGTYLDVITSGEEESPYADAAIRTGKRLDDTFDTERADRFLATVRTVLETGRPETIEYGLAAPAGQRWFEATITPLSPADEPPAAVVWAAHDITERKQHERAVEALHDTALTLHTSDARDTICQRTITAAGSILQFDQSLIALADDGHLHVEAASRELPEDAIRTMSVEDGLAGRTYRTGESFRVDDLDERDDIETETEYRSVLSLPIGEHGAFQAVDEAPGAFDETDHDLAELLVAQTAAALTELEYERTLERKNERLEEFASLVSHDLRSPLKVAEGHLELARDRTDDDHLERVARAHDRMFTLIEDLLTLAQVGEDALDHTTVHLASLVETCWQAVTTTDSTLVAETTARIRADESWLRQLLENLLRNAVEHGGSDVTVTVGDLADGFYIADDGPGIPPDEREAVFEAGYSTQSEGTGIGLRIVARVVEAHDWSLHLTESADGGARFEITGVESAS